jgi:glycosyltransferase involved in cell wall biosynthesis
MILSTALPAREGIGFYAWNLARHLSAQGHTLHLITRGERNKPFREDLDGITIWRPTFWPLYPFHVDVHMLFVAKVLRLLDGDIDIIHVHTPLVKLPPTSHPMLVTVHTPMKTDAASIPASTLLGWLVKLQTPFSIRLEQQLFAQAACIMAVAHSVANELEAYKIDSDMVTVIGNGVDTTIFHPTVEPLTPPTNPYFLTAGRLAPRKGLEDLIACAAVVLKKYPNHRFLIAGAGPLERRLRQDIRRRGLEQQIMLIGHIADRQQLATLYQNATAYVHPAHYEGLPTVLLEAMACGTPVVATAVSGALDVVDGNNGLLVAPHAPAQLAETLMRLIAQPTLGQELGKQATETIQTRYSWNIISQNYLRHYQSMLVGGRA